MDLVKSNYSSSDSEYELEEKREDLPKLPDDIIYRFQKDPMPSRSNTFRTFVFLEVSPNKAQIQTLNHVIQLANKSVKHEGNHFTSLYTGRLNAVRPLHVTLSMLQPHPDKESQRRWIETMRNRITQDNTLKPLKLNFPIRLSILRTAARVTLMLCLPLSDELKNTYIKRICSYLSLPSDDAIAPSTNVIVPEDAHVSIGKDAKDPFFLRNELIGDCEAISHKMSRLQNLLNEASDRLLEEGVKELEFECTEIKLQLNWGSVATIPLGGNK
ncbi:HBR064Wp [Eremothecium sinecaudum]|uniref:HBR064Wp n=1 Tax=Eremothecium sinecaudum TaxID=45286 RepID=A0A109UWU4_9SACH|nr:HBR064Wp [Eremothecium sinecaudum]AMD18965.1 HBR064Wp [Eremothecium sinecaudum]